MCTLLSVEANKYKSYLDTPFQESHTPSNPILPSFFLAAVKDNLHFQAKKFWCGWNIFNCTGSQIEGAVRRLFTTSMFLIYVRVYLVNEINPA